MRSRKPVTGWEHAGRFLWWLRPVWIGALAGIMPGLFFCVWGFLLPPDPEQPKKVAYQTIVNPVTGQTGPWVAVQPNPLTALLLFPLAGALIGVFVKLVLIVIQKRRDVSRMADSSAGPPHS
jgi:hypothetical protein